MTNWLGVESAMDSQVPILTHYCHVMESSLWYITRLAALRPSHPCVQRRSFLQQPIQMPQHSRQSQIFKRAFAHLMMHDSFSVLFMLAVCGWGCRLDGERESVCVYGKEMEQAWGLGRSDCVKLLLTGRWGWAGVVGGEGVKDRDY